MVPYRFWIAAAVFFATFTNYMVRVNISMSIIAMINRSNASLSDCVLRKSPNLTINVKCKYPEGGEYIDEIHELQFTPPTLNSNTITQLYFWDEKLIGIILAAYGYGYTVTTLVGEYIGRILGPTRVIFILTAVSAALNALIPTVAQAHWTLVIVMRIGIGLMGGLTYSSAQLLVLKWAPPSEKNIFLHAMVGNTIGTVFTWPIVGLISAKVNWDWGFYATTIFLVIYALIFCCLSTDTPEQQNWMTSEELEYIKKSQALQIDCENLKIPYGKILTSLKFWSIVIAHFGNLWVLFLFTTGVPKYFVEVLNIDLAEAGCWAALPFLGRFFGSLFFGILSKKLQEKRWIRLVTIRRLSTVISHWLAALFMVLIILAECKTALTVFLMTITLFMNGAIVSGYIVNIQDLAPNFGRPMYNIVAFFGGLTAFIVPYVTGVLIWKHNGLQEWHLVFGIAAGVYFITGLIFILFVTTNIQSWNEIKPRHRP